MLRFYSHYFLLNKSLIKISGKCHTENSHVQEREISDSAQETEPDITEEE
jgi:hypothetical protein